MNRSGKTDSKISRVTRERLREMEESLRNETCASGNVEGIPGEPVDVPANQLGRELAASLPGNAGVAPTRTSNVSSTQMEVQMPILQREEPLPHLGSQSVGGPVGRNGGVGGTTPRCPPGFGTLTPAFNTTRFIFALPGATRPSGGFESLTASGTSPQQQRLLFVASPSLSGNPEGGRGTAAGLSSGFLTTTTVRSTIPRQRIGGGWVPTSSTIPNIYPWRMQVGMPSLVQGTRGEGTMPRAPATSTSANNTAAAAASVQRVNPVLPMLPPIFKLDRRCTESFATGLQTFCHVSDQNLVSQNHGNRWCLRFLADKIFTDNEEQLNVFLSDATICSTSSPEMDWKRGSLEPHTGQLALRVFLQLNKSTYVFHIFDKSSSRIEFHLEYMHDKYKAQQLEPEIYGKSSGLHQASGVLMVRSTDGVNRFTYPKLYTFYPTMPVN